MNSDDEKKIKESICPLINSGQVSLLLGAGFSQGNTTSSLLKIPNGDGLRDLLLEECNRKAGPRTTLKDAYNFAERSLPNFNEFLEKCFTVTVVNSWQESIFKYVWSRIYTTNIDNVLDVAIQQAKARGVISAEFQAFNYTESQLANNSIGTIPVVSIHGTIKKQADGFIFSNEEYGNASSKTLDWQNELAAKIMAGGVVVVGNQFDEADIDAHLAARKNVYGNTLGAKNWIVMPNPDDIKRENYIAAGFDVIDAKAEEFFNVIYSSLRPRSIDEIITESVPLIQRSRIALKAKVWFKEAFNPVLQELERARLMTGILRHFLAGAHPDWFYIANSTHAITSKTSDLISYISVRLQDKSEGVTIINVVGSSGSGKTTAIRASLQSLVTTYPYIYEYDSSNGIDADLLFQIISGFTSTSIIVFYSAAEYYYAVNLIVNRLKDKKLPHCLFLLEDRLSDYKKNFHQLDESKEFLSSFTVGRLTFPDAMAIAQKMEEHGLNIENFSALPVAKRAGLILDKEAGYGGDLLSALYSLTTHENLEEKIYQDYHSVKDILARQVLDIVSIMNSFGFPTPIKYVAGFLNIAVEKIIDRLNSDLDGVVICPLGSMRLSCRHQIIATYYFENCIAGKGDVDFIVGILKYLSSQFSIDDIKYHPIAYQMYKHVISNNFLYDKFFPAASKKQDTEKTYHEAQKVFGKDGVFWLHFGRYYRKIGMLDNAIDCFRTGLTHYDSFQTRHSLGTALLDKYIESNCADELVYEEGVNILDLERIARGSSDAYPTSTMSRLLLTIIKIKPQHKDALPRLKNCINFGIEHFKDDEHFKRTFKEYLSLRK